MPANHPDPAITQLNWALAVLAIGLWGFLYGAAVWREPAFRRWLELRLAQLRLPGRRPAPRRAAIRLASRPVPPRPGPHPARGPARPLAAPAGPVLTGSVLAARVPAPVPVRIAEWSARRLPLRYRLLGRPRPPVNDN